MSTLTSTDLDVTDVNCTNLKDASGGNSTTPLQLAQGRAFWWCTYDGSTNTVRDSFNLDSVTDNSTGNFTFNIDTDFGGAFWCGLAGCASAGSVGGWTSHYVLKAAGTFRIQCWDEDKNAGGVFDPSQVDAAGWGDA